MEMLKLEFKIVKNVCLVEMQHDQKEYIWNFQNY